MKRGWILSLGWLIWAGCTALLLPERMRTLETGLGESVRHHLRDTGFDHVDVAMDGQSAEVRWHGGPAGATDAQALRDDLGRAAREAATARPADWPFAHEGDWSDWATAPVITAVADEQSVPELPPPPPIVATEEDPRVTAAAAASPAATAPSPSSAGNRCCT